MRIQIYGPFFTNYSLAKVNRNLAIALSKIDSDVEVGLWCEKDEIDYFPTNSEISKCGFSGLIRKFEDEVDITIYNNFPKSFSNKLGLHKIPGKYKFMYLAWEESVYPKQWVEEVNKHLDGVFVTSTFVKKILKFSGVVVPIFVVPNGLYDVYFNLDLSKEQNLTKYKVNFDKSFKILHISTLKKRKGVDVLLKSYINTFTSKDDVVLIIKTFLNRDNSELINYIENLQTNLNNPAIELITSDLKDEEIASLHYQADIEVYPSRCEGFGLPQLESMYFCNPTVVTEYSSYLDFMNEENSFFIGYKIVDAIDSEFPNLGAKWAEPSIEDLSSVLKYLYENKEKIKNEKEIIRNYKSIESFASSKKSLSEIGNKIIKASLTATAYTWENSAREIFEILKSFIGVSKNLKKKNFALIGSYNDDSGISEYSKMLFENSKNFFNSFYILSNKDVLSQKFEDDSSIFRLWNTKDKNVDEVLQFIKDKNISTIHIQFHSAQFSVEFIDNLLKGILEDVTVFITFHNLQVGKINFLNQIQNRQRFNKIFLHNTTDIKFLPKDVDRSKVFVHPLPIPEYALFCCSKLRKYLEIEDCYPIIATHGLLNTNKNIDKILDVIEIIKKDYPKVLFLSLSAVSPNNINSQNLYKEVREYAISKKLENNFLFITDFLSDIQIAYLLKVSDLIFFNYSDVGESASAAISKSIAVSKPTVVTDIRTFADFDNSILFKVKQSDSSEKIASLFCNIINDSVKKQDVYNFMNKYRKKNYSERILLNILKEFSSLCI